MIFPKLARLKQEQIAQKWKKEIQNVGHFGCYRMHRSFFLNNIILINNSRSGCYFHKIAKMVSCRLSSSQQGTYRPVNCRQPTWQAKITVQGPIGNQVADWRAIGNLRADICTRQLASRWVYRALGDRRHPQPASYIPFRICFIDHVSLLFRF